MRIKLLAVLLLFIAAPMLRADPTTHAAAAKKLFETMHMKELLDKSITQMTDMQIQQNPGIAPYRQIMIDFIGKYMSWDSLSPDMTRLYMERFTETEINELTAFYSTPTGQKAVKAMPELMAKGAAVGQQHVQEHISELQQQIAAEAAKQTAAPSAPPSAPPSPPPAGK